MLEVALVASLELKSEAMLGRGAAEAAQAGLGVGVEAQGAQGGAQGLCMDRSLTPHPPTLSPTPQELSEP